MKVLKEKLTQKRLKELVDYNPKTGIFTWKINRENVRAGSVAGGVNSCGYAVIGILNNLYQAHRLAFLFMKGYFPENPVDHIDQNKVNNKWENLREVSDTCNVRNRCNSSANTSGVKGVSWLKRQNIWQVRITVNYVRKFLGCYKDFDEAVCARLAAEQCLEWDGCDSNSPAFSYVKEIIKIAQ